MTTDTPHRPVLALTLGDVAGIGPEITAKTLLRHPELRAVCVPVVVGDEDAMRIGATRAGLDPDAVRVITDPRAATNDPAPSSCCRPVRRWPTCRRRARARRPGDGAYRFVVEACRLAREGARRRHRDRTAEQGGHARRRSQVARATPSCLAHEFGVQNFSLVLSAGDLYFFHLTAHVSLQQAIENCTPERTDDVLDPRRRLRPRPGQARTRPSASPASTPMPGRTASSATKTPTSWRPPSHGRASAASTRTARSPPTP